MFSVHCKGHGGLVLLDELAITRLENTAHGIELHWRCTCGTEGVELQGSLAGAVASSDVREQRGASPPSHRALRPCPCGGRRRP